MTTYHVEARWDPDAKVWSSKSDVPGLVIETATLAEFETLMRQLAPEMLADNVDGAEPATIEWRAFGAFDLASA